MAWQSAGAYTASDKCPVPKKGVDTPEWILCVQMVVTDREFLVAPVHLHVHVVTLHKWKTIMMVFIVRV